MYNIKCKTGTVFLQFLFCLYTFVSSNDYDFSSFTVVTLYSEKNMCSRPLPNDNNNLPYKTNAVNLVWLLGEYMEDYFNMKIALEKCA